MVAAMATAVAAAVRCRSSNGTAACVSAHSADCGWSSFCSPWLISSTDATAATAETPDADTTAAAADTAAADTAAAAAAVET